MVLANWTSQSIIFDVKNTYDELKNLIPDIIMHQLFRMTKDGKAHQMPSHYK